MRINRYIAQAVGLSRRQADDVIAEGKVLINDTPATLGQAVGPGDVVILEGEVLQEAALRTVVFNKPTGYVSSRNRQGEGKTLYEILPDDMFALKPVGRLDKDSSGLMLLTNDGELANQLTHPRYEHKKVYKVEVSPNLVERDRARIAEVGIELEDGISKFDVDSTGRTLTVTLREGRNRQIRRTFGAVGYKITRLHRIAMGSLLLGDLASGEWRPLSDDECKVITS